jgi:hypothetical protein
MPVAIIRPDSWDLPLFAHVLGAMVTVGGLVAVATLALASRAGGAHARLLARLALRAHLLVVLPGWLVMRVAAEWILSREGLDPTPDWVDVGFLVTDAGLILVLVPLTVFAGLSARRGGAGRSSAVVAALASVYVAALGVAWFAMSAKPGS